MRNYEVNNSDLFGVSATPYYSFAFTDEVKYIVRKVLIRYMDEFTNTTQLFCVHKPFMPRQYHNNPIYIIANKMYLKSALRNKDNIVICPICYECEKNYLNMKHHIPGYDICIHDNKLYSLQEYVYDSKRHYISKMNEYKSKNKLVKSENYQYYKLLIPYLDLLIIDFLHNYDLSLIEKIIFNKCKENYFEYKYVAYINRDKLITDIEKLYSKEFLETFTLSPLTICNIIQLIINAQIEMVLLQPYFYAIIFSILFDDIEEFKEYIFILSAEDDPLLMI
jgi:hypothetical protein